MTKKRSLRFWKTTIALAALILLTSIIPIPQTIEPPIIGFDKLIHASLYFFLTFSILRSLNFTQIGAPQLSWSPWGGVYAFLYGITLEGLQVMLPFRSGELADILANGLGCAAALFLFRFVRSKGWFGFSDAR